MARAGSAIAAPQAQRQDAAGQARSWRRSMRAAMSNWASRTSSAPAPSRPSCRSRPRPTPACSAADANLAAARQDQQRLAAERAGLRQQRDNVRLLAPSDGVVISRDAEPGSTVVAGQAVLRLIEPSSLWVKVRLDQGRSAGLAAGLRAQIVLRSNPAQPLAGKVARVEAMSDSVTEERVAQVAFDQPARRPVGGRTGRGDAGPAGHRAAPCCCPTPAIKRQREPDRRVAARRRRLCASRRCASARPAWTARCRCSTA